MISGILACQHIVLAIWIRVQDKFERVEDPLFLRVVKNRDILGTLTMLRKMLIPNVATPLHMREVGTDSSLSLPSLMNRLFMLTRLISALIKFGDRSADEPLHDSGRCSMPRLNVSSKHLIHQPSPLIVSSS
jgi:hypothetical protein